MCHVKKQAQGYHDYCVSLQGEARRRAQVGVIEVGKENVKRVIGQLGVNVKAVQEEMGVRLVVQDDGRVHVYAPSRGQYAAAEAALEGLTGADVRVSAASCRVCFLCNLACMLAINCTAFHCIISAIRFSGVGSTAVYVPAA